MLPVGTGSLPSLWQGECAPYWFTNTRNSYDWPGQILLLIPEAPLMSISAFNANRKTAGTGKYHLQSMCPLQACPPCRQGSSSARQHGAKAVWALTGCPRAAAELCGVKAETWLGGDQESESGRSTGRAADYAHCPSCSANLLIWGTFDCNTQPALVLQVKMKAVEHTLSIVSIYCNCR